MDSVNPILFLMDLFFEYFIEMNSYLIENRKLKIILKNMECVIITEKIKKHDRR